MTDKEIRELAEKTKKEKYCKLYECSDFCPILDIVDALHCENKIYEMAFLDGFKAAMEHLKNELDKILEGCENGQFEYCAGIPEAIQKIKEHFFSETQND